MEKQSIQGLYFEAPDYPNKLKHCIDGPIVLFQKGQVNWTPQPIISIIGTRNITSYGRTQCEKIIQTLAVFNPTIVSGFAYGADITAHKAALNNKLQTVACMAQGLQNTHPKQHIKYRQPLEINGGFVTDFWSTAPMNPSNFVKRNRLIAGLSEATIIIESAEKGGSLTTAEMALLIIVDLHLDTIEKFLQFQVEFLTAKVKAVTCLSKPKVHTYLAELKISHLY